MWDGMFQNKWQWDRPLSEYFQFLLTVFFYFLHYTLHLNPYPADVDNMVSSYQC